MVVRARRNGRTRKVGAAMWWLRAVVDTHQCAFLLLAGSTSRVALGGECLTVTDGESEPRYVQCSAYSVLDVVRIILKHAAHGDSSSRLPKDPYRLLEYLLASHESCSRLDSSVACIRIFCIPRVWLVHLRCSDSCSNVRSLCLLPRAMLLPPLTCPVTERFYHKPSLLLSHELR